MPLGSTGAMRMGADVNVELGSASTTQISLGQASVRTLIGVQSGAVRFPTDFYGKSNAFAFTITSNQTNANLRTLAIAAGWNQSSAVTATVASNVYVYSTSVSNAGLTINGSWPGGVALVNNGFIIGRGGDGAYLTPSSNINSAYGSHVAAQSGSAAISLGVNVTITNNSYIAGGGGGGAVGNDYHESFGGGGGGAGGGNGGQAHHLILQGVNAGLTTAAGGSGGGPGQAGANGAFAERSWGDPGYVYNPGSYYIAIGGGGGGGRILPGSGGTGYAGNFLAKGGDGGGAGGGGGTGQYQYRDYFGYGPSGFTDGGNGGSANNAGSNGSTLNAGESGGGGGGGWGSSGGSTAYNVLGSPGAGGKAVALNGFTVTWLANGTRYGAIS